MPQGAGLVEGTTTRQVQLGQRPAFRRGPEGYTHTHTHTLAQVQASLAHLKKQKPVLRWQLCAWKYVLSMPEKFSGRWSSEWMDHAWGCGSVLLFWHELTAYEEWYVTWGVLLRCTAYNMG
eukprot:9494817-Pyramimonas_sp.AAC.2